MSLRNSKSFHFPVRKFDDPVGLHKNFRYIEDYMVQLKTESFAAPDIVVRPSDSSNGGYADVRLTGSGDWAEIISVVAGGDVSWLHFMDGTINGAGTLTLVNQNLKITGAGMDATTFDGTGVTQVIDVTDGSTLVIEDVGHLSDGGNAFMAAGGGAAHFVYMSRVKIDTSANGVDFGAGTNFFIDNCYFLNIDGATGLNFLNDSAGMMMSSLVDGSDDVGVYTFTSGDLAFIGNRVVNSTGKSFEYNGSGEMVVVGNIVEGNGTDIPEGTVVGLNSKGGIVGFSLEDLDDVVITAVTEDEVLAYDDGTSMWINQTAAEAGLAAAAHTHVEANITDLDHDDVDAIHDNVASEISAITAKGSPTSADFILIEDAADSNNKKRITIGDLPGGYTDPLTTKGDLVGYNTATDRIPVGSEGEVLFVTAADAEGLAWRDIVEADISDLNHDHPDGDHSHDSLADVSVDDHHTEVHTVASTGPHAQSGLTVGHVLRASAATAFDFAQLQHADVGGQGTDDHHAEAHSVASHNDTTATGAELETLTDGSNADSLHAHVPASHTHVEVDVTDLDHDDVDAIHDNVASEISAITAKGTPTTADFLLIEDAAAANVKKHITIGDLPAAAPASHTHVEVDVTDLDHDDVDAIHDNVASEISAITNKATGAAGDFFIIEDSAAANVKKHLLMSGIRVTESQVTDLDHDHPDSEHTHAGLSGIGVDDHHSEAHTVASHSDTTATGAELETLTDGSNADALHVHAGGTDADAIHDNVASEISAITNKSTIAAGDFILIEDSAAANVKKHTLFSELEAVINHDNIAGVTPDDHHVKYTDAEAAAKIAADDLYVQVAGDAMGGNLDMATNNINNVTAIESDALNGGGVAALVISGQGQSVEFRDGAAALIMELTNGGTLDLQGNPLTGVLDPTAGSNVGDRDYNDARYMAAADPPNAHTIASHSDTTATGAELETLTDGSNADALHAHAGSTSPLTTKGDLWVYDTADTRLPIGTDARPLLANSADAQGMTWGTINMDMGGASIGGIDTLTGTGTNAIFEQSTGSALWLNTNGNIELKDGAGTTKLLYDDATDNRWEFSADVDFTSSAIRGNSIAVTGITNERAFLTFQNEGAGTDASPFAALEVGMRNVTDGVGRIAWTWNDTSGTTEMELRGDGDSLLSFHGANVQWNGGSTGSAYIAGAVGSAAAPAYTFSGDTNTGMYRYGADEIGFAINGVVAMRVGDGGGPYQDVFFGSGGTGKAKIANATTPTAPTYTFDGDNDTGMYRVGADDLGFAASGALMARIDERGIHTTSVSYGTEPWATNGIEIGTQAYVGTQGSYAYGIHWNWERGSSSTYVNKAVNSFTTFGSVEIGDDGILFRMGDNASPTGPPTTRWRINNSFLGNTATGVSASSTVEHIAFDHVNHIIQANRASNVAAFFGRSNASDGGVVDFRRSGTQVGSISVSSGATAYNVSSDETLKDNITAVTEGFLEKINAVPVRAFDWKEDGAHVNMAFVAQEVYRFIPDAVSPPSEDGTIEHWQMDYGKMTPVLWGGIQELTARIEAIERKVE